MTFTLFSDGLLSKWGFHDGALFGDFIYDYGSPDGPDVRSLLVAAVKAYLLPKLTNAVEISEIVTIHNPIRAAKVDGCDVDWFNDNPHIRLEPESVEITKQDLLALFPSAFRDRWANGRKVVDHEE